MKINQDDLVSYCHQEKIILNVDEIKETKRSVLQSISEFSKEYKIKYRELQQLLIENNIIHKYGDTTFNFPKTGYGELLLKRHPDKDTVQTMFYVNKTDEIFDLIKDKIKIKEKVKKQKKFTLNTKLPECVFLVDTESTGMNGNLDRLVSIGIAYYNIEKNKIIDRQEVFIDPKIPNKSLNFYRNSGYKITNIALPNMEEFNNQNNIFIGKHKAAKLINSFIQKHKEDQSVIIGHAISNDVKKINHLFSQTYHPKLNEMGVKNYCTFKLANYIKANIDEKIGLSLNALCYYFDVDLSSRSQGHGALIDAILTGRVIHQCVNNQILEINDKKDYDINKNLHQYNKISIEPIFK